MNEQLGSTSSSFLILSKKNLSGQNNIRAKRANGGPLFWTVIGVIVGVIALGVSIIALVITANTYNSRYDADAQAAGGLEYIPSKW